MRHICRERCGKVQEFLLDNSVLQATSKGCKIRAAKALDAEGLGGVPWGQKVRGVDEGDGWLRLGHSSYLPTSNNGIRILTRLSAAPAPGEACAASASGESHADAAPAE